MEFTVYLKTKIPVKRIYYHFRLLLFLVASVADTFGSGVLDPDLLYPDLLYPDLLYPDLLYPDLLYPDLSVSGPFVSGPFVSAPFVSGPCRSDLFARLRSRQKGPTLLKGSKR